jgi:hypothetical protein
LVSVGHKRDAGLTRVVETGLASMWTQRHQTAPNRVCTDLWTQPLQIDFHSARWRAFFVTLTLGVADQESAQHLLHWIHAAIAKQNGPPQTQEGPPNPASPALSTLRRHRRL